MAPLTFKGDVMYDSLKIPIQEGFKDIINTVQTISSFASKVFDVATKMCKTGSPPGMKFALTFPSLFMGFTDSDAFGCGWKVDGTTQNCKLGCNFSTGFDPFLRGELEFKILDSALGFISGIRPLIVKLKEKYPRN